MGKQFDETPTPLLRVPTTTAQFDAIIRGVYVDDTVIREAYLPDGAAGVDDREADDPSWYSTD
jgi:hypothetical protein